MKKIAALSLLALLLTACSLVHKRDVVQGNVLTVEEVSKIHMGMSEGDVESVLGKPVLTNIFSTNRVEYVYTFKKGHGQMMEKKLILMFDHGRVSAINKTF